MADPFTGVAVGVLFQQLYVGASKLINNYIDLEPLLGDLERTLAALNPLIQNINAQNVAAYPNEVIENLKKDIVEGLKLVRKYSEAGAVAGCLKRSTTYTTQIRKLDDSLRRQLEILNPHQIWVTNRTYNLVTLIAEELNFIPKNSEPNYRNDLVCYPIEVDDCSSLPLLADDQNDAVPHEIKSNPSTVSGSQRAGVWFLSNVLYDNHKKLISKSTIFAPILKDSILSSLDSYGTLLKQIEASSNEVLGYPKEEVERVKAHMEEGIKIVKKCSKVRLWHVKRRSKYANILLKWDGDLERLLVLAQVQTARVVGRVLKITKEIEGKVAQICTSKDGVETNSSVVDAELKIIREQVDTLNQYWDNWIAISETTSSRHMEKAPGGVEMRSGDVLEGMSRIEDRVETNSSNMEAGIKRIEDRLDTRNEAKGGAWYVVPELAQFTVGLCEHKQVRGIIST